MFDYLRINLLSKHFRIKNQLSKFQSERVVRKNRFQIRSVLCKEFLLNVSSEESQGKKNTRRPTKSKDRFRKKDSLKLVDLKLSIENNLPHQKRRQQIVLTQRKISSRRSFDFGTRPRFQIKFDDLKVKGQGQLSTLRPRIKPKKRINSLTGCKIGKLPTSIQKVKFQLQPWQFQQQ